MNDNGIKDGWLGSVDPNHVLPQKLRKRITDTLGADCLKAVAEACRTYKFLAYEESTELAVAETRAFFHALKESTDNLSALLNSKAASDATIDDLLHQHASAKGSDWNTIQHIACEILPNIATDIYDECPTPKRGPKRNEADRYLVQTIASVFKAVQSRDPKAPKVSASLDSIFVDVVTSAFEVAGQKKDRETVKKLVADCIRSGVINSSDSGAI